MIGMICPEVLSDFDAYEGIESFFETRLKPLFPGALLYWSISNEVMDACHRSAYRLCSI
jgi:hypothetical protein